MLPKLRKDCHVIEWNTNGFSGEPDLRELAGEDTGRTRNRTDLKALW